MTKLNIVISRPVISGPKVYELINLLRDKQIAGVEVTIVTCEHYAIIDQDIVWYGSMNLLAKSNVDDSMMRVQGKKIAMELMSLMFGKESQKDANNRA